MRLQNSKSAHAREAVDPTILGNDVQLPRRVFAERNDVADVLNLPCLAIRCRTVLIPEASQPPTAVVGIEVVSNDLRDPPPAVHVASDHRARAVALIYG